MGIKIYTKPNLVHIPLECVKWPRSAQVKVARARVAWTRFVSEKTMISKSVEVHASRDKIWELLGDPEKIPVYTEGVIDIEFIDENTLKVTDVYRAGNAPWETQVFTERITDKQPLKLIKYEIEREEHKELFTFMLEDGQKEDTTIVTLQFEGNFALANPEDVETMMEKVLVSVARVVTDKRTFQQMVRAFAEKELGQERR